MDSESDPLACDDCGEYLSHAPIFQHPLTGEAMCALCASLFYELTRSDYFELLARHFRYPCKYEEFGCSEILEFYAEPCEEHPHEVNCKYRGYYCPLEKIGCCDWEGPVHELYLHFLYEHPLAIFDNPCVFHHDIEYPNIYICLVPACGELFLVQAEVLVPEGIIFHSVRLFGRNALAHDYKFELFIQRNDTYISRTGNVLPMDTLEVNESTSITTKIFNLFDLMEGYTNTQFIVNIRNVDEMQDDETEAYCHYCNQWKYLEQGICNTCRPELRFCFNRLSGCCHMNLANKMEKHELYYCNYVNWCEFCNDHIYPEAKSKSHHYVLKHTVRDLGTFITIARTNGSYLSMLFRAEFGIICCHYYLSNKKLELQIITPLLNVELRNFQCKLYIEGPTMGHIAEFVLEQKEDSFYDWVFSMQKGSYSGWSTSFKVKIEVLRN